MLFDTHVHLNARQYEDDLREVMDRAQQAGVTEMTVVGFDEETIPLAIQIAEENAGIYAAVGWHPVDAIHYKTNHGELLKELSAHPKVVALGEMGLDYHWDTSPKDVQGKVFREQIQLAHEVDLPIIIHNRDATADVITILRQEEA